MSRHVSSYESLLLDDIFDLKSSSSSGGRIVKQSLGTTRPLNKVDAIIDTNILEITMNYTPTKIFDCSESAYANEFKVLLDFFVSSMSLLVKVIRTDFKFEHGNINGKLHLHGYLELLTVSPYSAFGLVQVVVRFLLSRIRRKPCLSKFYDMFPRYLDAPLCVLLCGSTDHYHNGRLIILRTLHWQDYINKDLK